LIQVKLSDPIIPSIHYHKILDEAKENYSIKEKYPNYFYLNILHPDKNILNDE